MPTKGHAFDKWKVNEIYKDDKRKQAVVAEAAASAAASKDDLYKQLSDEVAKSAMDADRKEHAFKVIGIACKRLRDGQNLLEGLRPPASCEACRGNSHRTHHFLCMNRTLEPGIVERNVRTSVMAKLGKAWRVHQYEAKVTTAMIERDARAHISRHCLYHCLGGHRLGTHQPPSLRLPSPRARPLPPEPWPAQPWRAAVAASAAATSPPPPPRHRRRLATAAASPPPPPRRRRCLAAFSAAAASALATSAAITLLVWVTIGHLTKHVGPLGGGEPRMEPPRPGGRGSDRFGRRCCLGRLCCSRLRHSNRFH